MFFIFFHNPFIHLNQILVGTVVSLAQAQGSVKRFLKKYSLFFRLSAQYSF